MKLTELPAIPWRQPWLTVPLAVSCGLLFVLLLESSSTTFQHTSWSDSSRDVQSPDPIDRTQRAWWLARQQRRLKNIQRRCQNYSGARPPQAGTYVGSTVVDPKHRTVLCYTPKSACSSWKAAVAYLSSPLDKEVSDLTRTVYLLTLPVHEEIFLRSVGVSPLSQLPSQVQDQVLKDFSKVIITRHPIERLLSYFREKLLDEDDAHFKKFGLKIKSKVRRQGNWKAKLTFTEFVLWLLKYREKNVHWASAYEVCRPCEMNYDYIVQYDTFTDDTSNVMDMLFNSSMEAFPQRNSLDVNSRDLLENEIQKLTPAQIAGLQDMYKDDFDIFGWKKYI